MWVHYKDDIWEAKPGFRETYFEEKKRTNPNEKIKISKGNVTKEVPIVELTDHSVYRNTTGSGIQISRF